MLISVLGISIAFITQILLILYLNLQQKIYLKRQLLDEEDKMLKEFSDKLPDFIAYRLNSGYFHEKYIHPYIPYLTDKMEEKIKIVIKLLLNKEEDEIFNKWVTEFQMLILNRRIEIKNEKERLTKFWKIV